MSEPKNKDRNQVIARLGGIVGEFQQQARDDVAVLEAARRAPELESADEADTLALLPKEELAALGWTKQALRIAKHAMLPKSAAPVYLLFSHERHVQRLKIVPTDGDGNQGAQGFAIPVDRKGAIEADADDDYDDPEGE